jgi:spermidine synthase
LATFLDDVRFAHHVADGRVSLEQGTKYDVIEIDALWPTSAYAGNLYSVEFFSLCARHLKPGGLMSTWSPTPRVYAGFRTAFAHVLEMRDGQVLLGSNEPIRVDHATWRERLHDSSTKDYLGDARAQMVLDCIRTARLTPPKAIKAFRMNLDLFPRDEFWTP